MELKLLVKNVRVQECSAHFFESKAKLSAIVCRWWVVVLRFAANSNLVEHHAIYVSVKTSSGVSLALIFSNIFGDMTSWGLILKRWPTGFTPTRRNVEQWVALYCHGNPSYMEKILHVLTTFPYHEEMYPYLHNIVLPNTLHMNPFSLDISFSEPKMKDKHLCSSCILSLARVLSDVPFP